ncbi:hypothetical protein QFC19_001848 [Naganishia cerealis]|uniref:Uncharacterized protein n=1 Tax=Naganishia cerealis TaxID=610337 RepID=A0ACC2WDP7_9TREE|nr:hypothetical protein QFC19_001848 [Naganishia cerealis]
MASYLSPRNIRVSGKQKAPSPDVVEALKLVSRHSVAEESRAHSGTMVASEEVSTMFPLVEHDIEQHFSSIKESTNVLMPEDHEHIARMMSNLFDSMILWQSGWNRPLKHVDLMLGYLPKYSSMLVDIAYERIQRLVCGDVDVDADEEADEAEDEGEPWSRPMLAILRKEVQFQVVSWLYTYISCAETKDIITQYVSTIRAVKIVDASGILLHAIAAPIQAYLQQRKDTINCIVTMLLESNELIEEGEDQPDKIKPVQVKYEQAEDWSNPNWDPEPIDAAPEFQSQKASDIISTFVGMYESREVIMIEVQQWLAKRLLNAPDYDVDAMIMDMEKLKLRFGDAALHVCDIMLKDLADSKRINNRIQSECQVGPDTSAVQLPLKPKILSHLYWPAIKEPKFRLPKKLQKIQERYGHAYHKFRQDKKLKFYHQGTVNMAVHLGDRELELEVTLLQAAVLETFAKRGKPMTTLRVNSQRTD